ncbi:MAG: prepilin peptidase [Pseudomonadota bacterium]
MLDSIVSGFQQSPLFFYSAVFVLAAAIGSFINVVIHRFPIMMEREFKQSCEEYFESECTAQQAGVDDPQFNLVKPASRCPRCGEGIRPWHNLPIIGYLWLRGRCKSCGERISLQYPAVELLTAITVTAAAVMLGPTVAFAAAAVFTFYLIAMSGIDIKIQMLPDAMTLPLLWLGLLLSLVPVFIDPTQAILGAALGYLSLWSVYWLFKLATGKEGMGYGDFKLLALLGAWTGPTMLPLIIVGSAAAGALIGLTLIVVQGRDKAAPMPFGPYLAIAGWIAFLWGDRIMGSYLGMF